MVYIGLVLAETDLFGNTGQSGSSASTIKYLTNLLEASVEPLFSVQRFIARCSFVPEGSSIEEFVSPPKFDLGPLLGGVWIKPNFM